MIPIGAAIREARSLKQLSQGDLSELSGVRQQIISRLESGEVVPSLSTLSRIAQALGIDLSRIVREAERIALIYNSKVVSTKNGALSSKVILQ